jgi:hypothetical protein
LAYHIAGVLEKIRDEIPYDAAETPSMQQLCTNTEAGPLDFRCIRARSETIGRRGIYEKKTWS